MGKTKIKIIDDSQPDQSTSGKQQIKGKVRKDSLVEELNRQLGVDASKEAEQAKVDEVSQLSGSGEDRSDHTGPEVYGPDRASPPTDRDRLEKQVKLSERGSQPKKQTPTKLKPRSKRYLERTKLVNLNTTYPLNEAVDLSKKVSYSRFDGSLEIHLNTKLKNLKGSVSLPFASAKKPTILAFGKGAKESGADLVGDDSTLKDIQERKINFDILITTPEWMEKLAPLAKELGPKGLMPNPKNGTITEDLKKAVSEFQSGKVEYKTEPNNRVVHISLGKLSQPNEELVQNIKVLLSNIGKTKLSKVVLSPTMGPGVKLDLSTI